MRVGEPAVMHARPIVGRKDTGLIHRSLAAPRVGVVVRQAGATRHVHVGELPLDSQPRLVGMDER